MAIIPYARLVEIIKSHPDYSEWEKDVSADIALYIKFGTEEPGGVRLHSDDCETVTGLDLILMRDGDGKVHGVEIT